MRTFYVADVSISPHPSPVARVLHVRLLAFEDRSEMEVHCDLYEGHEMSHDFRWNPRDHLPNEVRSFLKQVAADFREKVSENKTISWDAPGIDARIEEFESTWKKTAFHNALRAYDVTNRLTFEQALRVLEEHYIVAPVMES